MEIFKDLPLELKYYIMYNCNGIQHPVATIIKDFVKENDLYKTEQFKEPNFYQFLRLCNILRRQIPTFSIREYDSEGTLMGYIEFPMSEEHFEFLYDIDSDSDSDY